jgi:hypothetical protein
MKGVKTFYFFVRLSLQGEPITPTTRFTYFLVCAMGKANSVEAEMKAGKKAYTITALLSQRYAIPYTPIHMEEVSPHAANVLQEHFPFYDHHGDILALINHPIAPTADEEQADPEV